MGQRPISIGMKDRLRVRSWGACRSMNGRPFDRLRVSGNPSQSRFPPSRERGVGSAETSTRERRVGSAETSTRERRVGSAETWARERRVGSSETSARERRVGSGQSTVNACQGVGAHGHAPLLSASCGRRSGKERRGFSPAWPLPVRGKGTSKGVLTPQMPGVRLRLFPYPGHWLGGCLLDSKPAAA